MQSTSLVFRHPWLCEFRGMGTEMVALPILTSADMLRAVGGKKDPSKYVLCNDNRPDTICVCVSFS